MRYIRLVVYKEPTTILGSCENLFLGRNSCEYGIVSTYTLLVSIVYDTE